MKVKVNFEFNLEDLIEASKDHILLEGRSNDDIVDELIDLFDGDLNRGFSDYCKNMFVLEFEEVFNY
jgi:hypothetical protein